MSYYLGYEPTQGDAIIDTFTCDGITDIYTLSQSPAYLHTLEVSVGGLIQSFDAFSLLTSNGGRDLQVPGVATGTKIIVRQHGEKYAVGTVSNNTILSTHIQDNAVTTAKIPDNAITNAKILSLDADKLTNFTNYQYGQWQPTLTTHSTVESNKSYYVDTTDTTYVNSFQDNSGTTDVAIDESLSGHTLHWYVGNSLTNEDPPAAMIDTVNAKVGSKSMLFDHSASQYVQISEYGFDHADWTFGTNPFTIEMWIRPSRFDNKAIIGFSGHNIELNLQMDASDADYGHLQYVNQNSSYDQSTATGGTNVLARGLIKKDEWAHVAVTRNAAGATHMWVNGINAYTSWNEARAPWQDDAFGCIAVDTFGAADASRTAGTYTGVTGTSSRSSATVGTFKVIVDASTGNVSHVSCLTGGSGHVVNDVITIADSSLGGGGAADFTCEVSTVTPETGSGNIAVDTNDYTTGSSGLVIGNDTSNNYFAGNIDHVRISNVCRYGNGTATDGNDVTTSFTPPTEPWKPDDSTLLILNVDDARMPIVAGIDHSTGGTNGKLGDPKIDSQITKFGASSIKLDGDSSFLKQAMSDKWAFGTGDYTVETWIYKTENQSQAVVANGSTGSANSNHWIMKSKTGFNSQHANINFSHGSGDLITSDSDYDFPLNKWVHVAADRQSGNLRVYIDGVCAKVVTSDTTDYTKRNELWVGAAHSFLTTSAFNGYVDDLRISNICRYMGSWSQGDQAFAVPTTPHVTDANTVTLLRMEPVNLNITLPPSPVANDVINIWDIGGQCSTNPIHLLRNGKKIKKSEDIVALDNNGIFATLVYKDETYGWLIKSNVN